MGFHSSHGNIRWSYNNYTRFVRELHEVLADHEVEELNVFDAHAHSENGYDYEKCSSLANLLAFCEKDTLSEDNRTRLEHLIFALREAHAAKEPLRFM